MGVLRRQIRLQQKGSKRAGLPIRRSFVQGIPGRIAYHKNLGSQLSKALVVIEEEKARLIDGKPSKKLLRAHLNPRAKGWARVKRTAAGAVLGGVVGGALGAVSGLPNASKGQVKIATNQVAAGALVGAVVGGFAVWRGEHEDRAVRELQILLKKKLYVVKRDGTQLTEWAKERNERVVTELYAALTKLSATNSERLGYLESYIGKPNR